MIHKRWLIKVTQLVYFTIIPLCDTIVTLWHASCDRCDIDESHYSEFFSKENFRDWKSVKISVFVVWSECQFNVRNVYFEKSKFSKKKIKNSDTKKLKIFKKFVCLPPSDKQLAIKFQFRAYARFFVISNYKITFFA